MKAKALARPWAAALLLVLSVVAIGTCIPRTASVPLLLSYTVAFISYLSLCRYPLSETSGISLGIVVRLMLFLTLPSLSDDVYRFIWDGTLLANGISPYDQLPGFYVEKNVAGLTPELYEKLNSPAYFTVYPPINQLIFWVSAAMGQGSWLAAANVMRTILLACDLGTYYFLKKALLAYKKPGYLAFFYFLNPLAILEVVGNLHFEGMVVFFLAMGIYFFKKQHNTRSAMGFGLAIGIKLLPLIFLPALFFRGLWSKKWPTAILAGCFGLITLLPLLSPAFLASMRSSLSLYFQNFEFNASLYFLIREVGFLISGYNQIAHIGPALSVTSGMLIIVLSVIGAVKKWPVNVIFLVTLSTYLFFATTVHPWYILPLIFFGLLSGFCYPVAWSFLIFLTYLGYDTTGYQLPAYLIIIEYLAVASIIFIEVKTNGRGSSLSSLDWVHQKCLLLKNGPLENNQTPTAPGRDINPKV